MSSNFITFHVPDDQQLLAVLGELTLRHEHLNHILKMTIKTIARLTPSEAIDATQYEGSRTSERELESSLVRNLVRASHCLNLNRPDFSRHLAAIQYSYRGGVHVGQALSRRVQDRSRQTDH